MSYLFTSESVSEGHPDKVADQISDPTERAAFLALFPQTQPKQLLEQAKLFLARFPQSAFLFQVYEMAARASFGLGDYDAGLNYARQSLTLLPENPLLLVSVGDVVAVNLFFAEGGVTQGVFNLGTGHSRSFNDVARVLIARLGRGEIRYVPFPESLRGKYQSFTEADITRLRAAGYDRPFASLEQGVDQLCASLAVPAD